MHDNQCLKQVEVGGRPELPHPSPLPEGEGVERPHPGPLSEAEGVERPHSGPLPNGTDVERPHPGRLRDGEGVGGDGSGDVTTILHRACSGDRSAADHLYESIYGALHDIASRHMSRERPNHTLQATGLVNECYLRMIDQTRTTWRNRAHFLSIASDIMWRILKDHAKARRTLKRDPGAPPREISADDMAGGDRLVRSGAIDHYELSEALERLGECDPTAAKIVINKYFGRMTTEEIASEVGLSPRAVERSWAAARAKLAVLLSAGDTGHGAGQANQSNPR